MESDVPHSYEEIRDVVIDFLSGNLTPPNPIHQFNGLVVAVADHYTRQQSPQGQSSHPRPDAQDEELVRDVFWDLFRQGHITLGWNSSNNAWPFFRLSHFGKKALTQGNPYRFTDTSTYIRLVKTNAPRLDDTTIVYLDEAVRDFYAGCFLSASVMLGVAAENLFNRLLSRIEANPNFACTFGEVLNKRFMLARIEAFQRAVEPLKSQMPNATREDLDTNLGMIQAVLRTHRNSTGHPTGETISREQMFVHLQLFATFARKLEQLEAFFGAPA